MEERVLYQVPGLVKLFVVPTLLFAAFLRERIFFVFKVHPCPPEYGASHEKMNACRKHLPCSRPSIFPTRALRRARDALLKKFLQACAQRANHAPSRKAVQKSWVGQDAGSLFGGGGRHHWRPCTIFLKFVLKFVFIDVASAQQKSARSDLPGYRAHSDAVYATDPADLGH